MDVDGLTRYSRLVGGPGFHDITVAVDDPGAASRVNVIHNIGAGELTGEPGWEPEFGSVTPLFGQHADYSDVLECYLSGYDSPVARLATVISHIAMRGTVDGSDLSYDLRQVVEWLRWLGAQVRIDDCVATAETLREVVSTGGGPDAPLCERSARSVIAMVLGSHA